MARGVDSLEAILRAASEQFAKLGFHGVKISKVCEAAGVANGTFYIYFKSKDELYASLLKRGQDEFLRELRTLETKSLPPALADLADVEFIVDWSVRNRWQSLSIFNQRALRVDGETKAVDRMIDQRAAVIAAGQKTGIFRKDIDPRLAAQAEIAVTTELVGTWLLGEVKTSRKELVEALWKFRLRLNYDPAHWADAQAAVTAQRSRASHR
jgi:TetR/AcrR family transcriptional regulator, fatty acid metabolism regulator protein